MNEAQKTIYNMIKSRYRYDETPTHTELVKMVNAFAKTLSACELTGVEIAQIVEEYEINIGIKSFDPESLLSPTIDPDWLTEKKKTVKLSYWERYIDYLADDKDFDESTIKKLQKSTEEILGYCANPQARSNEIRKRKGLVVGDVQSGKTANYLGLINMACDYGYKLIVVLAGLTDSLRKQTQQRIDEGFVGAQSNTIKFEKPKFVGVGKYKNTKYAVPVTNYDKDFTKDSFANLNSFTTDYNKPLILVVKKNKSTLQNVKQYLKPGMYGVTNHVLIIDDEADNASINTKKEESDPSTINSLIRDLFNLFPIASYVGYTATPFANIFINPDDDESFKDLFPSDFITLLKTPTSYFGATKVFGDNNTSNTKYIRILDEEEPNFLKVNHKKDDNFSCMPDSLIEAINSFYLNSVIRTLDGAAYKHRTMMINISRFNDMQLKIKARVINYVEELKNIICQTSFMKKDKFLRNDKMLKIYNLYMTSSYYDEYRSKYSRELIQNSLSYEAEKMKVIVANRLKDEEKLDYEQYKDIGARFIVIGGFVLSRGLTLEGLMISYYSRNGSAYDSLLQMCRWFGYRPKYENLCRVYLSEINLWCFNAVVEATEDLKEQFKEMRLQNKTPNDFGLMVKRCPDVLNTLLITSRNKSRNSFDREIVINYSNTIIDTSKIFVDKCINDDNLKLVRNKIEHKLGNLTYCNRYMYRNIDKNIIIDFLKNFKAPIANKKFDIFSICEYLNSSNRLDKWDIVFATGESDRYFNIGGCDIPCVNRSFAFREEEDFVRVSDKNNRLVDPGILNAGLSQSAIEELKTEKKGKTLTGKEYLSKRTRPILIIYPIVLINKDHSKINKEKIIENYKDTYMIGLGIGFPKCGEGIIVKYKLNKRKYEELIKEREEFEEDEYE